MASAHPCAALGFEPLGEIEWCEDLHVRRARVGDVRIEA
jgi:hypothetical protein